MSRKNDVSFRQFLAIHAQVTLALSNALDMDISPGSEYFNHPIFEGLRNCLVCFPQGKLLESSMELGKGMSLLKHLEKIKTHRPELFEGFKKLLRSKVGVREYFGVRFEINTAHTLIREGLSFTTPDPPDFLISHKGAALSFECTTTYSEQTRDDIFEVKINRAINTKARKSYPDPEHLALLIDNTNIEYLSPGDGRDRERILKKVMDKWAREGSFGSYLVFMSYAVAVGDEKKYEHSYVRFDAETASKQLIDLLDVIYPKRIVQRPRILIPKVG